jgi:hypothetical protein
MTGVVIRLAALAAMALALTTSGAPDAGPQPLPFFNDEAVLDTSHVREAVEEDEPGWDCRVHGNGICGPTQLPTLER